MTNPSKSFQHVVKQLGQTNEKFVIFYFFWVGGICTCVWNGILNSFDYFSNKFPNDKVTFTFPIPITVAQLIITLVITHLSKIVSYSTRIFFTLASMILFAFLIPFEADIFATDEQWSFGMYVIILLVFLLGLVNNACFASVLAFASQIHGKYSAFALIGIGFFGLSLNFLKEGVILLFHGHAKGELFPVLFYFSLVATLAVIGLILHAIFIKTEFYNNVIEDSKPDSVTSNDREALLNPIEPSNKPVEKSFKTLFEIFNKAKLYMVLVFIFNLQTNVAFPGLMLKKPVDIDDDTKNVSMIMTFNVLFLIGKFLGQQREKYNKSYVIFGAFARFVMIAFFIIQAVTLSIPILNTIWFGYLNIGLFGLTIGFGNVAFFFMVPEQVDKPRKEIAGFLTVIGINLGNLIGGLLALPLQNLGIKE